MAAASVAWAAAELLATGGARVAGVVMLGPFAWDHAMPFGVPTLLSVLLTDCWGASAWAYYYNTLYADHAPADLAAHVVTVKASLALPGRLHALREQMFALKAPCAERLPELAAKGVPLLAVWGTKDPDFTNVRDEAAELVRRVPHACVRFAEGAGHYPHAELPTFVADEIHAWLMWNKTG